MQVNLFTESRKKVPKQSSVVNIKKIEPEDEKKLELSYSFHETIFGKVIIASSALGICYLAFEADEHNAIEGLKKEFSSAKFIFEERSSHVEALKIFDLDWERIKPIQLHVYTTDFQKQVWEKLLNIPFGSRSTYGAIADELSIPNGARAVGTAVGSNPLAFLIPCHRVIQNSGGLGGFRWGIERKKKILLWEEEKVTKD